MINNQNLQENKTQAVFDIELSKIKPNPYQPRIYFDDIQLTSLADSIKQYGVLQPIVVSRKERYQEGVGLTSEYEIIAGERRFRAAKLAGLERIPAIIRENDHTNAEKLELAIIENLQREDLNSVDRALAFKKLVDEFGLKHIDIALKLGKSREFVSNSIRLLLLPEEIKEALSSKIISEGHAKPLLMLKDRPEDQMNLFRKIIASKLTVRSAERLAREIATDKVRKFNILDPEIKAAERRLSEKLGTKVHIEQVKEGGAGKITIEYFSKEDLDTILLAIKEKQKQDDIKSNFGLISEEKEEEIKGEKVSDNISSGVGTVDGTSLYDSFLASKREVEQKQNFIKKMDDPIDKSLDQDIDKINNFSFSPVDDDNDEPDIIREGEISHPDIEMSSVVSGSDFLAAKEIVEIPEEEEKEIDENYQNQENNPDFGSFSI